MIFNYVLGIAKVEEGIKVNRREAVRAVVFKNRSLILIHSCKGDYKFPGGGVKKGERHEEALIREVREESGYLVENIKGKIGTIIERKKDEFEADSVFEMVSHYYLCELGSSMTIQELDDYEAELDFKPVRISIDEAIRINDEVLGNKNIDKNPWVYRETCALKALREYFNRSIEYK